jgi:putative transposase
MLITALKELGVPVTVACKRLNMPRATFYKPSMKRDSEIKDHIREIALKYPSYGYRRITAVIRRQGIILNHKRLYRLYRMMGLQRAPHNSNRRHSKARKTFTPTEALYPGHVWSVDFIHDCLTTGRQFKVFNILDVFSRRAFEPCVDYSLPGETVARHLDFLCLIYGPPRVLRRDDGPEFRSKIFQSVLRRWRIHEEVIPPGQPFDNGSIESFHGKMRQEVLDAEVFNNITEAKEKISHWIRKHYNAQRPHSSLGYKTPLEVWNQKHNMFTPKLSHN